METIDIYSKGEYPSNALSNFYPHPFSFDGVQCGGMEGFLQALKYRNVDRQKRVCALSGKEAKKAGKRKFWWKWTGKVFWLGVPYKRRSEEFQTLLRRAYQALYGQNEAFRLALKASEGKILAHTMGGNDPRKTILTEAEFLSCLNELREGK